MEGAREVREGGEEGWCHGQEEGGPSKDLERAVKDIGAQECRKGWLVGGQAGG